MPYLQKQDFEVPFRRWLFKYLGGRLPYGCAFYATKGEMRIVSAPFAAFPPNRRF